MTTWDRNQSRHTQLVCHLVETNKEDLPTGHESDLESEL